MNERTIIYIGSGAYISGVPARNLTPSEYEQYKELIEACPHRLYQLPEKPEVTKGKSK